MNDYDYDNYAHDYGYDEQDDDDWEWEYEEEPTWFYEWHGHFFYDKPTLKQKILVTLSDIKNRIMSKLGLYDDIPF